MEQKPITYWIDYFMQHFPEMTAEESHFIYQVLHWEPEKRAGFLLAKTLFETEEK